MLEMKYGGLVGRDSLPRPTWAAGCVVFAGVTSAVLLTPFRLPGSPTCGTSAPKNS